MRQYCFVDFETTGFDPYNDYPIEVAAILTDTEFTELRAYTAMIAWSDLLDNAAWRYEHQKAANVHKISWAEYEREGRPPGEVVVALNEFCAPQFETVLTSDNIHFDYSFLEALYKRVGAKPPFSYLGFDTGLLFDVCGVKDPDSDHRALPDVRLVLDAVRRATVIASVNSAALMQIDRNSRGGDCQD